MRCRHPAIEWMGPGRLHPAAANGCSVRGAVLNFLVLMLPRSCPPVTLRANSAKRRAPATARDAHPHRELLLAGDCATRCMLILIANSCAPATAECVPVTLTPMPLRGPMRTVARRRLRSASLPACGGDRGDWQRRDRSPRGRKTVAPGPATCSSSTPEPWPHDPRRLNPGRAVAVEWPLSDLSE